MQKLKVKTKEQKIIKAYIFIAILFTITFGTSKIVLAADDPLEVVNNLSDLIFRMVKIIFHSYVLLFIIPPLNLIIQVGLIIYALLNQPFS